MSPKVIGFANGEFYHVFNRSINKEKIFYSPKDLFRARLTLEYYRNIKRKMKLSYFLGYSNKWRETEKNKPRKQKKYVDIICYCFMPNHYHLLLRQLVNGGISRFMALFQNSYTRYFNTIHDREGHLFKGRFKRVHVQSDNQLLHLSRYIHLNPYSSGVVKKMQDALNYPYSSMVEYLYKKDNFLKSDEILGFFNTKDGYKKFVLDGADYQRSLKLLKGKLLDEIA